jgi:hypothetical protein
LKYVLKPFSFRNLFKFKFYSKFEICSKFNFCSIFEICSKFNFCFQIRDLFQIWFFSKLEICSKLEIFSNLNSFQIRNLLQTWNLFQFKICSNFLFKIYLYTSKIYLNRKNSLPVGPNWLGPFGDRSQGGAIPSRKGRGIAASIYQIRKNPRRLLASHVHPAYMALLVSLRGSTPTGVPRWAGPIRLSFFLFCKSGNMFKLDYVLIQILCSNLKICLNSNLFKFEFV